MAQKACQRRNVSDSKGSCSRQPTRSGRTKHERLTTSSCQPSAPCFFVALCVAFVCFWLYPSRRELFEGDS